MRRRDLLAGLALAFPTVASLQADEAKRPRTIGVLFGYPSNDAEAQRFLAALSQRLEALGLIEGRSIRLEIRFAAGDSVRVRTAAQELAGLMPDVIVSHSTQLVKALSDATRTIPIVFAGASDPVESGLVASLAQPGGNVTGFSTMQFASNGKLLELLREIAPSLTRVAVVMNSGNPSQPGRLGGIEANGKAVGIAVSAIDLTRPDQIDGAIDSFAAMPGGGLVVLPGSFTGTHRASIIAAAARGRLPAMYPRDFFVRDGGLMSFNADQLDQFRQAADYVDRILKGENPGRMPVQTPTHFDLTINLATARQLGLTVPQNLLARASEVFD